MNRYIRHQRNQQIVELYKRGLEADQIAAKFKLSRRAVYHVIAKLLADAASTSATETKARS